MKHLMLSLLALIITSTVLAQQNKPTFKFDKTHHDFGTIKEEGGRVTCKFKFKNTGSQPLVIYNVQASCGCTTPDWTRRPIAPGADGYVQATFDPRNRIGKFSKTVMVAANTEPANIVLHITGIVTPHKTTLADIYPRQMGQIRMKTSYLSFTKIAPKAKKTEEIELINDSKEKVSITFDMVPAYFSIKAVPSKLAPGQKGKFIATYNAAKKKDWGFVYDQFFVKLNGHRDYRNHINISANIQEDFNKWTEDQKVNAPKLVIDNNVFDFKEIKQGAEANHTFVITNKGKSNLILRKVKASCGCTVATPEKTVIVPGESTNIKVHFNSSGKSGYQNKSVSIITNDPLASNVLLRIQGNVNNKR